MRRAAKVPGGIRGGVLIGAVLVAAPAVGGLVAALSYAPLAIGAYGPGAGISTRLGASDGKLVFAVQSPTTSGEFRFVVRNTGRWPVTIDRSVEYGTWPPGPDERKLGGSHVQLAGLRRPGRPVPGGYALSTGPLVSVRVPAHGSAELWVRVNGACFGTHPHTKPSAWSGWQSIELHYRYLGLFDRTQQLEWPFELGYAC